MNMQFTGEETQIMTTPMGRKSEWYQGKCEFNPQRFLI